MPFFIPDCPREIFIDMDVKLFEVSKVLKTSNIQSMGHMLGAVQEAGP